MSALRWAAQHKVQAVAVAGVAQLLILLVVLYLPSYLASRLYMLQELFVYPWNSKYQGRYVTLFCCSWCCTTDALEQSADAALGLYVQSDCAVQPCKAAFPVAMCPYTSRT